MKILFLILVIFIYCSQSNAQWIAQQSNTANNLQCVYFTDAQTGYICGDNVVLKTVNAGTDWVKTDLPGWWNSISFANSSTGYICGFNGKIMKTTNSGANWISLASGTTKNLNNITIKDENTLYFTGWQKTFVKSTDGGITFSSSMGNANYMWLKSFLLSNYIFLMGTEGILFRSFDSGNQWDSLYVGMPNTITCAQFFPNGTGFLFGCCGAFFRTSNFGDHWNHDTVYLTNGWALEDCFFSGSLKGWSAGEQGNIVRTTDGGNSWEALQSGTNLHLKSVKFVNEQTGWIVGYEGLILKTTNGGGAGSPIAVQSQSENIPQDFSLLQNFPNPFNPSTTIKFLLNKSSDVKISIFDINGKLENVLSDNFYRAGEYSLSWNAVNKPSGIYYCRIETSSGNQVIKMTLIK